jgi:hypothetical protein
MDNAAPIADENSFIPGFTASPALFSLFLLNPLQVGCQHGAKNLPVPFSNNGHYFGPIVAA